MKTAFTLSLLSSMKSLVFLTTASAFKVGTNPFCQSACTNGHECKKFPMLVPMPPLTEDQKKAMSADDIKFHDSPGLCMCGEPAGFAPKTCTGETECVKGECKAKKCGQGGWACDTTGETCMPMADGSGGWQCQAKTAAQKAAEAKAAAEAQAAAEAKKTEAAEPSIAQPPTVQPLTVAPQCSDIQSATKEKCEQKDCGFMDVVGVKSCTDKSA